MNDAIFGSIVSFIWTIADDVLRDVFVRGKYRDVILPMTVLRRLDAVLEPTKEAVLDTKQMLDELGDIGFWKLAIKPGKPFAFGKLDNAWFCGLPGNPVSAALTFYQLVQPLIAKLSGHAGWRPPLRLNAVAATKLKKSPGRLDFQRGIFSTNANGELEVRTTGHQGSHVFSSFSQGNCFIVLERERGSVSVGETVEIELFNGLLGQ